MGIIIILMPAFKFGSSGRIEMNRSVTMTPGPGSYYGGTGIE